MRTGPGAIALFALASALSSSGILAQNSGLVLTYGTFLGGDNDDSAEDIALDASGSFYVTGDANSYNFPTTLGAYRCGNPWLVGAYVTKFSPSGGVIYSTYLNGGYGWGIAVDPAGCAYVAGATCTANPSTTTVHGACGEFDATLMKLSASGSSIVYSVRIGGAEDDQAYDVALGADRCAYVTGFTKSRDFPVVSAFQTGYRGGSGSPYALAGDAFVAKVTRSGATLAYSTLLGGSGDDCGRGIVVDEEGHAYVVGFTDSPDFPTRGPAYIGTGGVQEDTFVAKLNPSGASLDCSRYLGGSGEDIGEGIALRPASNRLDTAVCITGFTDSMNFPTTANVFQPMYGGGGGSCNHDAFVACLSCSSLALEYSTYLGGDCRDRGRAIAVDQDGCVTVGGWTASHDFPTHAPFQARNAGGHNEQSDAFITRLDPYGMSLIYSTYFGGEDDDFLEGLAVDPAGSVYIVGDTFSANFPTRRAFQATRRGDRDGFAGVLEWRGSLQGETFSDTIGLVSGQTVSGDSAAYADDYSAYRVCPYGETGPDVVYRITLPRPATIQADLSNLSCDLDLMLCCGPSPQDCIQYSAWGGTNPEQIVYQAPAAGVYYLVVDGYAGGSGTYDLSVAWR